METTVLDDLDAAASQRGGMVAVSDGALCLTWAQVRQCSQRLAAFLCRQAAPGARIGVFAPRQSQTPVLFLAVVAAGCCYVPLDAEMPAQRLACILQDTQPTLLLGVGEAAHDQTAIPYVDAAEIVPALAVGALDGPGGQAPAKKDGAALAPQEQAALARRRGDIRADTPLYLVYTSGSTGTPKGILKTHGAVRSFVSAFLQVYPMAPSDVIGNQSPFFFDASAKDLYWWLRLGCRLEILAAKLFSFPVKLIEAMDQCRVTVISWVPSALCLVSQLGTLEQVRPQTLRLVCFVGEVFPVKQLLRWQQALPKVRFVNLYGSSEIAGVCCHYPVPPDLAPDRPLPLGHALPHCRVTLQDKEGRELTAAGVEGEICVESPSLAAGYWRDEQRTATVFRGGAQRRVLHTGDMAFWDQAGELVFTSRRDFQVKHMGHRIELGEIEAVAAALPQLAAAACIYDARHSRIVLFAQPIKGEMAPTPAELLTQLRQQLCNYMVPQRVLLLEELPHNRNGKVDRPYLQKIYEQQLSSSRHARKNSTSEK